MMDQEKRSASWVHFLALGISLPILLVVSSNFASQIFKNSNPDLALAFNSFNLEARVNSIKSKLGENADAQLIEQTAEETRTAIRYEPYEARLFSLLGYALGKQVDEGSQIEAQKLFDYTLKLDQANLLALYSRLQYFAITNDPVEAMQISVAIFRAWPQNWDMVAPVLPEILQYPEAYALARDEIAKIPKGPASLTYTLSQHDSGLQYATRLLLDWRRMGLEGLQPAVNTVVWRLMKKKQYLPAHSLFLFSLDDQQRQELGYIFNPNFEFAPSGNPFDWKIPSRSGLSSQIIIRPKSPDSQGNNTGGNEFEFKFLNTPIRLNEQLQYVRLPKAPVIWETSYSTKQLVTPKPLKIAISCVNDNRILAEITIQPEESKKSSVKFDVPPANCDLQIIRLYNENIVESWNNRYQGSLLINNMSVRLSQ